METPQTVSQLTTLQLLGSASFGFLIGWLTYFINRYRSGQVQVSDLVTIIGVLGGGVIIEVFQPNSDAFGAYGIGLLAGFMGYFFVLVLMVQNTKNFSVDWFLDGRRKAPRADEIAPDWNQEQRAFSVRPPDQEQMKG